MGAGEKSKMEAITSEIKLPMRRRVKLKPLIISDLFKIEKNSQMTYRQFRVSGTDTLMIFKIPAPKLHFIAQKLHKLSRFYCLQIENFL